MAQVARSLSYRLRGLDPVAYLKGQHFSPPRTLYRRYRKVKWKFRTALKAKLYRMQGVPWEHLYYPPPPKAEPKLVRAIKNNIRIESLDLLVAAPIFERYKKEYQKIAHELDEYRKITGEIHENFQEGGVLYVDELPPGYRKIMYEELVAEDRYNSLIDKVEGHFSRIFRRQEMLRSVEWTFNQLGYSREKRKQIQTTVNRLLNENSSTNLETFVSATKQYFRNEKACRVFFKKYNETHEKLADHNPFYEWKFIQARLEGKEK